MSLNRAKRLRTAFALCVCASRFVFGAHNPNFGLFAVLRHHCEERKSIPDLRDTAPCGLMNILFMKELSFARQSIHHSASPPASSAGWALRVGTAAAFRFAGGTADGPADRF
jgi:hypothetical protein